MLNSLKSNNLMIYWLLNTNIILMFLLSGLLWTILTGKSCPTWANCVITGASSTAVSWTLTLICTESFDIRTSECSRFSVKLNVDDLKLLTKIYLATLLAYVGLSSYSDIYGSLWTLTLVTSCIDSRESNWCRQWCLPTSWTRPYETSGVFSDIVYISAMLTTIHIAIFFPITASTSQGIIICTMGSSHPVCWAKVLGLGSTKL